MMTIMRMCSAILTIAYYIATQDLEERTHDGDFTLGP
jgi:hypothetical protein